MNKPTLGPRQIVHENAFFQVSTVQVQFPGFAKTIYVTHSGPRVGVLLIQDDHVLLVRQYRLLINDMALEIPGGKVDDGETPQAAALRECQEETCFHCLNLQPLLYYHPGLDTTDNPTSIFYCTQFAPAPHQQPAPNEVAELVWLPFSRCLDLVFEKQIIDCLSVTAILAWQARKTRPDV